jgi:hypothetical protein
MTDETNEPQISEIATPRRHHDVFTPVEAAAYLGFDSHRSLETVREHYGLLGHRVGKCYLYHRADLDACVLRMFGKDRKPPGK